MTISAAEQYELELINRARLDPEAEAARYGISLNEGLAAGTISAEAKQVLAPNADLEAAAQGHSEWMLANDVFIHTGAGGSSAGTRIVAEGYLLNGTWGWAENLSAVMTTGTLDLEAAIEQHHSTLFLSEVHRTNTLNGQLREIGIAQVQGQYTSGGVTYNTAMLTENFAYAGTSVFVTGVVYDDTDGDAFYGIGEGLSGIKFTAAGTTDTSEAAGGYSVGVSPARAVSVSVTQGAASLATLTMDLSTGNGKLDLVMGANDIWRLELSASATLVAGIADATLLGVADLNLTGHGEANQLTGNKGGNILDGAGGNDRLFGADGSDALYGGTGNDHLDGGAGADVLNGGQGNDTYVVETVGDWVQEDAGYSGGGGIDRVDSWVSFAMTANTEFLVLQGDENLNGTGRSLGADAMIGNSGNNVLDGLGGNDGLNGGWGNDTLIGGAGRDWLMGSSGADSFVYRSIADSGVGITQRDMIDGFERGLDKIHLSEIDANAQLAGNQAFRFIGDAEFTATAGEIRGSMGHGGNFVLLEMDTNGDALADMQIFVVGTSTLAASDFVL